MIRRLGMALTRVVRQAEELLDVSVVLWMLELAALPLLECEAA